MNISRWTAPLALGFLLWSVAISAMAQSGETGNVCVQDFQPGAVCTANDVRIEELTPQMVIEDCASGVVGETEVVFEILVSADGSPDRFDIGLYLALDGGSARDGDSCFHDFLDPPLSTTPTLGDANMDGIMDIDGGPWLENDGDGCGDIGTNTQVLKVLPALRFACIDSNMDGSADVAVCTSWDNNANTVCNDLSGAFPGTNSKCSCDSVELGIVPVVPVPGVTVAKDPPTQAVTVGGSAVFTITVDNTGNVDLTGVVVDDPQCTTLVGPTGDTNTNDVLETTETWSYTCTVTNVTTGFINTATATATPPTGPDVSDSDTADVTVDAPSLTVAKNPASQAVVSGDSAVFTITVDNSGNVDLTGVVISDPQCTTLVGPTGDTNTNDVLETTETWTYTCTVTNVTTGFTNTATATGTPPTGAEVSDSDTADVTVENPSLTVTKDPASQEVAAGDSAVFTITVDNTGDVDLTGVMISDPQCTTLVGPTGDANTNDVLETTETWTYTCTVTNVTTGFTNTATASGTPPTGPDVSDSDTADVTVQAPEPPAVSALKTSALLLDNDGSGSLTPGDTLEYTIVLDNGGSGDALDVVFADIPDPNTTLVVGSVTTTQGVVTSGNTAGDTDVEVDIGTLAAAGQVTVVFEVDIDDPLPDGVTVVSNQGIVSGSNFPDVPTDDPATLPTGDPTEDVVGALPDDIPTLSQWGLILLTLLLAGLAVGFLQNRRSVQESS